MFKTSEAVAPCWYLPSLAQFFHSSNIQGRAPGGLHEATRLLMLRVELLRSRGEKTLQGLQYLNVSIQSDVLSASQYRIGVGNTVGAEDKYSNVRSDMQHLYMDSLGSSPLSECLGRQLQESKIGQGSMWVAASQLMVHSPLPGITTRFRQGSGNFQSSGSERPSEPHRCGR